nr:hypothetical protein [Planococcus glaciei]
MTDRSTGIHEKIPENFVEVSPELAEARDILDGSIVRLVFSLRRRQSAGRGDFACTGQ